MTKIEFLSELKSGLAAVPSGTANELISFYDEAISDRIESGIDEESAVAQVGDLDTIIKDALSNLPMTTVFSNKVKESHEKAKGRGLGWLWTLLTIVGFPVWFPLLLTFSILFLTLYFILWTLVFVLFILLLCTGITSIACLIGSATVIGGTVTAPAALGLLGVSMILAGSTILLWKPITLACKGLINMINNVFRCIKKIIA